MRPSGVIFPSSEGIVRDVLSASCSSDTFFDLRRSVTFLSCRCDAYEQFRHIPLESRETTWKPYSELAAETKAPSSGLSA
jgi:hypothetical protein